MVSCQTVRKKPLLPNRKERQRQKGPIKLETDFAY